MLCVGSVYDMIIEGLYTQPVGVVGELEKLIPIIVEGLPAIHGVPPGESELESYEHPRVEVLCLYLLGH